MRDASRALRPAATGRLRTVARLEGDGDDTSGRRHEPLDQVVPVRISQHMGVSGYCVSNRIAAEAVDAIVDDHAPERDAEQRQRHHADEQEAQRKQWNAHQAPGPRGQLS